MLNKSILSKFDDSITYFEELEDALLGFTQRYDLPPILAYDYTKCINIIMSKYNYDICQATDYFEYNIECCSPGEFTPVFIKPLENPY